MFFFFIYSLFGRKLFSLRGKEQFTLKLESKRFIHSKKSFSRISLIFYQYPSFLLSSSTSCLSRWTTSPPCTHTHTSRCSSSWLTDWPVSVHVESSCLFCCRGDVLCCRGCQACVLYTRGGPCLLTFCGSVSYDLCGTDLVLLSAGISVTCSCYDLWWQITCWVGPAPVQIHSYSQWNNFYVSLVF